MATVRTLPTGRLALLFSDFIRGVNERTLVKRSPKETLTMHLGYDKSYGGEVKDSFRQRVFYEAENTYATKMAPRVPPLQWHLHYIQRAFALLLARYLLLITISIAHTTRFSS